MARRVRRIVAPRPAPPLPQPRKDQKFSIGILTGDSPDALEAPGAGVNPVLTAESIVDVPTLFVADPFLLHAEGTWWLFFEIYDKETLQGEIGLASSADGLSWKYQGSVLKEPFHLSYPYVFEWMNEYYMIPESYKAKAIRLYKAREFPRTWSFVGTVMDDVEFVDSSVFRWNDRWWMLAGDGARPFRADVLRLYFADDLLGPWHPHPKSPVIDGNPHIARPGGRVLVEGNRIVRYAQDCHPEYGLAVRGFEITELTPTRYAEREIEGNPILSASGAGWNAAGMHHIDPHPRPGGGWIAAVDGFYWPETPA